MANILTVVRTAHRDGEGQKLREGVPLAAGYLSLRTAIVRQALMTGSHDVCHMSLLKSFINNGESVAPMPFTQIGGTDYLLQVKKIIYFRPSTPKQIGAQRRVKELSFCVKLLGLPMGTYAWQTLVKCEGRMRCCSNRPCTEMEGSSRSTSERHDQTAVRCTRTSV